jgi:uncharacterized protein with NAD-binding domain and iron-sulfur cluster
MAGNDWTRREILVAGAGAAGAAAVPGVAAAGGRWAHRRRPTVAVLGGGVGGLTAAHELAERGFAVTVYERRALGGKARSIEVPHSASGRRRPLPGEHGMRTFIGFYQNIPDTLRRIPFGSNPRGVFDNLTGCSQLEFARAGGREDLTLPLTASTGWTVDQVHATLIALLQTGIPPQQAEYFAGRLMVFFSSCDARRFGQWEPTSWETFVKSGEFSQDYRRLLTGWINRELLAAEASDVSALTVGLLWEAGFYNLMQRSGTGSFDRVLDLPTNEAWIDPWVAHLRSLGVRFRTGKVEALPMHGDRVGAAVVRGRDGRRRHVHADWFVLAVPVERAVPLVHGGPARVDPGLRQLATLKANPEVGIQFYLREETPIAHGHVLYVDSPWWISSISQAQFWPARDIARDYGNGRVRECLSVDVAAWDAPGILYGKPASRCTPAEFAREVWAQLKASLNDSGRKVLRDRMLDSWFLDPGVGRRGGRLTSADPLMISTPGSWARRPKAATKISNLFLAADYARSHINVASMEGANDVAKNAVNALLAAAGSHESPARVFPMYRPPEFEELKAIDRRRYAAGQSNVFDTPA